MSYPNRLANGAGNWPDAVKWNDNYDFIESMASGNLAPNPTIYWWSYGTSFTNPASGTLICDEWYYGKAGSTAPTCNVARDSSADTETHSAKLSISVAGSSDSYIEFRTDLLDLGRFNGKTVYIGARIKCSTANKVRMFVYDGTNTVYSAYHTGGGQLEKIALQYTHASPCARFQIGMSISPADFTGDIYFDSAFVYVVPASLTTGAAGALDYNSATRDTPTMLTTMANANDAVSVPLAAHIYGGGNLYFKGQTTTGIASTATAIGVNNSYGGFMLVMGRSSSNYFFDVLIVCAGVNPVVLHSANTVGSPAARTYTATDANVKLSMASGTYTTNTFLIEMPSR